MTGKTGWELEEEARAMGAATVDGETSMLVV